NNPPLIAPFVTAASSAAVNNLLGTEITGGTGGTGVAGCYPTPVTLTGTGPFTLSPSGGLPPVLIASQGSFPTTAINNSLKAPPYGFQVGYNHQFLSRFVGGFEADFHVARGASDLTLNSLAGTQGIPGLSDLGGPSFPGNAITTNFAASQTMRYFGTVRA